MQSKNRLLITYYGGLDFLLQLPILDILDLIVHCHIAFVSCSLDVTVFYSLNQTAALVIDVGAGRKPARADIIGKIGETKRKLIFFYKVVRLKIKRRKAGSVCNIAAADLEKLNMTCCMASASER